MKMASDEVDVPRLVEAMGRSRLILRRYREERREMVKRYAGNHWGAEGAVGEKRPLNKIGRAHV